MKNDLVDSKEERGKKLRGRMQRDIVIVVILTNIH